jgi:hypothetical protein
MSSEKRRDPRFDSKQKLWCEGQGQLAEARNMSQSGMFIVAEQPREVGTQFKVAFEGDTGEVELDMEVMWCGASDQAGHAGMGLRIVGFGKGQEAFDRFVQNQLEQQGLDEPDDDK